MSWDKDLTKILKGLEERVKALSSTLNELNDRIETIELRHEEDDYIEGEN
jgi:hypothetical protein